MGRLLGAVALCAGLCGLLSACGYPNAVRRDIRVLRVAGNAVIWSSLGDPASTERYASVAVGPALDANMLADRCYRIVYAPVEDQIIAATPLECN